jgi:excisionase family DNA binding protein
VVTEARIDRIDRLLAAADRLASTLAVTEKLLQHSASLLDNNLGVPAGSADRKPRVVPLSEAASRTGRHPDVLRRWCASGRIPATRVGRTWALPESEVIRLEDLPRRHRRAPITELEPV